MSIHLWLALIVAIIALCYDVTQFRIPNWLAVSTLLLGIAYYVVIQGFSGMEGALIGAVVGFFPMFLVFLLKGIGAGDVKLFAGLGALLQMEQIIALIGLSFIYAGIVSIVFIVYQFILKQIKRNYYYANTLLVEKTANEKYMLLGITKLHQFPFMLAVAPAMLTLWFLVA